MIESKKKKSVFIIAEAGVNHNGDINLAYQLIDAAKAAGADCVKFQTYITENDTAKNCEKAEYQKTNNEEENQYDLIKKLELSFSEFVKLKEYCEKKEIIFLSSPFDLESVKFLETLDPIFWKVASSEITNYPFLRAIAKTHRKIVMSTGMCDEKEIEDALKVLKEYGAGEVILLHCNTEYPTPMEDVNLREMLSLKEEFQCKVGYSDHTLGIQIPIAAVALGAEIIEKHFTLDHNLEGPDHKASLEPEELKQMVHSIRMVESALGDGQIIPSTSEKKNRVAARKSVVANRDIKAGEVFTEENIAAKRPGGGISPMKWKDVLGKVAKRDFIEDEKIEL